MSQQSQFINENELTNLFQSYLQEMKVGVAFDQILDDMLDEDFSDAETFYVLQEILTPAVVCVFAKKYSELDEVYGYDSSEDLNAIFETFCAFEHLSGDLQNCLAATINNHAAAEDDDENDDDNDVVYKPTDWDELSDHERQAKVKAFLKKIANAHNDARDLKPFLKNLNIGDQPNPRGIKVGERVKTFDRAKNRYGHKNELGNWIGPNESTIAFPEVHHDGAHERHPLHKTALKYGYAYSHTTPVQNKNAKILQNYHTWVHPAGHQLGAYANDRHWSSKTSVSSGHVFTGHGTFELEAHLKSKQKRYKLQNNEGHLPTNALMETLLDPESIDKVKRYADFMNKNPATSFGHQINEASQAEELRKTWKMKEEAEKKFGSGKDQADWGLFDYRSGKPR